MDDHAKMHRRMREAVRTIALECRHLIQGCLREEEWRECDREFEAIILPRLEALVFRPAAPRIISVRMSKVTRRTTSR